MDPNIIKFLEEDEDETMHSGADVEAFTAELNRDIEGSATTSQQQPLDSDAVLSSQSQFLSQWQTSSLDEVANFQGGQDLMAMEENKLDSSQVDVQKHGCDSQNREEDDNSSHEPNSLARNPSVDARPQPRYEQNTFSLSQPMGTQTSAEQPINIQGLDHEPYPEKESQMDKVQNISHHPSMAMGSNDQQPLPMDFKDQQSLSTGKVNQPINMGISSEQVMPPVNQHITGMMMSNKQAMTSGMSNQHSMTNTNQQPGTSLKLNKQVPFGMVLHILLPQLEKDRAMQLNMLYFKLKKKEISKDDFIRHMRSIVGDQKLRLALYKLQAQAQPQAHARQMQVPSNAAKLCEVESQADSQGAQVSQMPNSSSGALSPERKHPVFPKQSSSWMPSLTFPVGSGINSKTPPKKPLVDQKKPMEASGSLHPSSKKQKMSEAFLDQSIEQLNDVTAVSGVNLRLEEEQLFSGPKEDSQISEASRQVVQEEEERLMLQKIPLQKKLMEIMAKCGLKNMSNDVEKCLSLCMEERMRGLISNIIRLSKQRVDIEKPRHKTIITSDVKQQITTINRKALEEWEKKQAETEKSQKLNEPESSTGVEGDKDKEDNRAKSTKVNKEDTMCTTAANSAVRAAIGVGDMLSRWQLMAKQGGSDTSSVSQTGKDVGRNHVTTSIRNTRESQEPKKRDSSTALATPASIRRVGRNQVVVPQVARSISVKDVIAALEREPQTSKSTLLYRLYRKASSDATGE
ncbi:hypothetical protein ACS0TY_020836 [Phlomoides rotata]